MTHPAARSVYPANHLSSWGLQCYTRVLPSSPINRGLCHLSSQRDFGKNPPLFGNLQNCSCLTKTTCGNLFVHISSIKMTILSRSCNSSGRSFYLANLQIIRKMLCGLGSRVWSTWNFLTHFHDLTRFNQTQLLQQTFQRPATKFWRRKTLQKCKIATILRQHYYTTSAASKSIVNAREINAVINDWIHA